MDRNFKTLKDLLKEEISAAYSDVNYLYVKLKPDGPYENIIWIVNKISGKVTKDYFTNWLIDKFDGCHPMSVESLKDYV